MNGRKPPGMSWESFAEQQIEEGRRAGLFDRLEGEGKPLAGLDQPHDPDWWVKAKLRDEQIVDLPPSLAIRGERNAAVAAALAAPDVVEARRIIDEVNDRIRYVNSHTVSGPPSTVWVVDVDDLLERWRAAHPDRVEPSPDVAATAVDPVDEAASSAPQQRRWWGRRRRRR